MNMRRCVVILGRGQGQALIEVTLFGSLALVALSLLIQYGLRMNYQQELEQQTFRRALLYAKCEDEDNHFMPSVRCGASTTTGQPESAATSLQQFRDRQMPSPTLGFGIMPRVTTSAASTVTWGERLTQLGDERSSQARIVLQLNGNEAPHYRSEDMKKVSKADPSSPNPSVPCQDFYDCVKNSSSCDPDSPKDYKKCREDCRKLEEDTCLSVPIIHTISKTLRTTNDATVTQTEQGTRLDSEVQETTTMTLNTKQNPSLDGPTLQSKCHYEGTDWHCGN